MEEGETLFDVSNKIKQTLDHQLEGWEMETKGITPKITNAAESLSPTIVEVPLLGLPSVDTVNTDLFSALIFVSLPKFAPLILSLFMMTYIWIIDIKLKWSILIFIIFMGATILYELIADYFSIEILKDMNRYIALASVPSFYLYGRLIGGYVGKIAFDGVSRDVYFLPTLKINYKSYLLAKAPARQWIFFFGGIGTVITSLIASAIVLIFYDDPFLFLFPIFLFIGEIFDYLGVAGFLSGGEFNHLKREHKIIKDWQKNL